MLTGPKSSGAIMAGCLHWVAKQHNASNEFTSQKRQHTTVTLLYFISWLTDFAAILFIFVSTRLLADEQTSAQAMGYLGAAYFLVAAIANTISGPLSDYLGKRKVSFIGTVVMVAAIAGIIQCEPGTSGFYVSYTAVGLALGVIYPPIMAALGTARSGQGTMRTYLFFCLAFNFGIACAQVAGGYIYKHVGPYAPFYVAIGAALLAGICLLFANDPSAHQIQASEHEELDSGFDKHLSQVFSRINWCANFSGMFSMSLIWFLLPKLIVQQSIEADTHGTIMACGRVCTIATFVLMYLLPKWPYKVRFVVVCHSLGAIGLVGIYSSSTAMGFGASVCVFSTLMGFNYYGSLYYSSTGSSSESKGKAFGLNEAFLMFGAVGGSILGAALSTSDSFRLPFAVAAGVVVASLILQCLIWHKKIGVQASRTVSELA